MSFIQKKELFEEKVKFFTKKYLGISLDAVTVVVVGVLILVICALTIFDVIEF
jgi:hypothetical protein